MLGVQEQAGNSHGPHIEHLLVIRTVNQSISLNESYIKNLGVSHFQELHGSEYLPFLNG